MKGPFHQPARDKSGQWRIRRSENGEIVDLCGAVNEAVAWDQCLILNRMHGWTA